MKKNSLLILMLTFLLIPTFVNANNVSWEDFVSEVNKAGDIDFETILSNSTYESNFKNYFNTCYSFVVLGDFGFTNISADNATNTKLFFVFNSYSATFNYIKNTISNNIRQIRMSPRSIVYILDLSNNTITYKGQPR